MFTISSDAIAGTINILDNFDTINSPAFRKKGETYALSFINLKNVESFSTFNYTISGGNDYRYLTTDYRVSKDNRNWTKWMVLEPSINNFPPFDPKTTMFIDIRWTRSGDSPVGIVNLQTYNLGGVLHRNIVQNIAIGGGAANNTGYTSEPSPNYTPPTSTNTPYVPTKIIGITGPQGSYGPPGNKGDMGYQGGYGYQGGFGPQGRQGGFGPQGRQGSGITGSQGNQGDFGPQGNQGDGIAGNQGDFGPQGNQGDFGPQGGGSNANIGSFSFYNNTMTSTWSSDIIIQAPTGRDVILSGIGPTNSFWANIIAQNSIPSLTDVEGGSIATDGTYSYIIGFELDSNAALLFKLDVNGIVIYTKTLGTKTSGECIVYKNGFLWIYCLDFSGAPFILQCDTDANIIGTWNFLTGMFQPQIYEIDVDEFNNVYFIGSQNNLLGQQMLVGKLNTGTNSFEWIYNMGDIDTEYNFGVRYNSGFVYTIGDDASTNNLIISKIDTSGTLIWSKNLGITVQGISIAINSVGYIYFVGSNSSRGAFGRLDPDGNNFYIEYFN